MTGGLTLIVFSAIISLYTGWKQSDAWVIMQVLRSKFRILLNRTLQKRWPQYRELCREPYPEMGYRVWGMAGRRVVSAAVFIQQFGLSVLLFLLGANNLARVIKDIW